MDSYYGNYGEILAATAAIIGFILWLDSKHEGAMDKMDARHTESITKIDARHTESMNASEARWKWLFERTDNKLDQIRGQK